MREYIPTKIADQKTLERRMKHAARKRVIYALKTGKLQKQPCEKCQALDVEAHHEDYRQPLKVNWYCRPHHNEIHKTQAPQVIEFDIEKIYKIRHWAMH